MSKLKRRQKHVRHNWVHQTATQIVSDNSLVATEKLNLKGMTAKAKKGSLRKQQKTGLNRSILNVGMGMLRQAIEYKVGETDGLFVEVPTKKVKPSVAKRYNRQRGVGFRRWGLRKTSGLLHSASPIPICN